MQVTREADYAIRCVLHLSANTGRAVSVGEIEKAQDVPGQFATKILQKLSKAGIVKSVRGAGGGFMLARAPEEISLLDVYEASSGDLALNVCIEDGDHCNRIAQCPVHPVWMELTEDLKSKMRLWDFGKLLRSQMNNPLEKREDKK